MFKSKVVLDGNPVETIMPYKKIEAFENYLKPMDEHYDNISIIVQEAGNFIAGRFFLSNEVIMVKEQKILIKRLLGFSVENVIQWLKV